MRLSRRSVMAILPVSLSFTALPRAARAETVVKVSLWDKGEAAMEGMDGMMPMGMAMPGADMAMATMGITLDVQEVPAGEVTFRATNDSGDFYHGMTISRIVDPARELPYLSGEMMVDEAAAGAVGRLKELKPHDSGSVSVVLEPGPHILYCNVAGHYMMGMWTTLTVTG